jgi:two-component system, OmpR family, sensor histidine kinase VicK
VSYSSSQKHITLVVHGIENTTNVIQQCQSNAKVRICACINASGPSITIGLDAYKTGLVKASGKGVKLKFVTEVTGENIYYCKELIKMGEVRHLDGVRGNFVVTEGEYTAFGVLHESTVPSQLIYSNVKELVEQEQYIFDTLWNRAIPAQHIVEEMEDGRPAEKTEVIYGEENVMDAIVAWQRKSEKRWNLSVECNVPRFSMSERIRKGYPDAIARGVEIRYITEITKDNLDYCKELMNFAQVRHLDGIVGNFVVSEKEYLGEASGKEFLSYLIYSNKREIVDQQNYIFENLWKNGIPAEKRIRLIEQGTIPTETRIIEDPTDIASKIRTEILNSSEIIACSQPGRLQLIYDNFFDNYREVLSRQREGKHKGIRLIVTIDRNTINLVKKFVEVGVQVRHVRNLLPLSFVVTDKEVQANLEDIDSRKMIQSLLTSNEPVYVKQFASTFEQLWDKGIDAKLRMDDIEEGNDNEIEVIQNPARALQLYREAIAIAEKEIMLIFPTTKVFVRQKDLGIVDKLKDMAQERQVKVRILAPSNTSVDLELADLLEGVDGRMDIRYFESMSARATILIVDKKLSLVMELKDDSKDTFFGAVGLSTYSSSRGGVLSYAAMFENLWAQIELMAQLKEANEQLEVHDKMQKEFINVAAHELRTPIQPILSLADALRSDVTTTEGQEILDIVIRNAERLQRLAEDILDIARIESQSFLLNKEVFCLNELLSDTIGGIKNGMRDRIHDINLVFRPEVEKVFVEADNSRIAQVISNLINNALRFTRSGTVSVIMETKGGNIIVSVKDTGSGIDPAIIPRLFTKFATKSITGTGLGLFISKSIIEAHGGKIWADNNLNEKGATFTFSLPLV